MRPAEVVIYRINSNRLLVLLQNDELARQRHCQKAQHGTSHMKCNKAWSYTQHQIDLVLEVLALSAQYHPQKFEKFT